MSNQTKRDLKAMPKRLPLNLQFFGDGDPTLKDLQDNIQKSFHDLKEMGDRQDKEIKQFGEVSQETKKQLGDINAEITKMQKQIDEIGTKANRMGMGGGSSNEMSEEQKAANAAFFKFMREGKAGMGPDERKALVEDSTGQIIVPEALDTEIYRELPALTVMRNLATVRPIGTDRQRRRSMTEVTTGWGKLETSATKKLGDYESTLVPSEEWLYVEDALGLTKIGEDELEDTDVNLTGLIADSFSRAYSEMEDTAFMVGTGHANEQPEGILTSPDVTRFQTGAAAALSADDFIKLEYEVKPQYRRNGSYIVNSQVELAIRLFKDNSGQYMWQPSLQAGKPSTFNGRALYNQEDISGTVATGNDVAVFGDIKAGYRILDRKQGSITRLNELYAEDGLVGFRYKRRVGGGVVRPNAMKVLRVQ